MSAEVDFFALAADDFQTELEYETDVARWAEAKLGVYLWTMQREIAAMTLASKRVGVRSCHSSGKSFLAAVLCCHHIDTHPAKSARIITTAPSQTQVRGVLWNEINGMWETAKERGTPLIGTVNQTEWWVDGYQAGIGRKPNDYKPEVFAGFHCLYPLIILDEADGLPKTMWDGVEALMTSRNARMLAIGNPLDPGSEFSKIDTDPEFNVIKIAYTDTPNFTGEDVPQKLKDQLIDQNWVDGRKRVWGVDNPFWYGRVLAEYPPEALATIIRAAYIELCMRPDEPIPTGRGTIVQLGVDVAGSEDGDWTSIHERRGNAACRVWKIRSSDDDAVENFVVEKVLESGASRVVIDATGFSTHFPGRIRKRCPRVLVIGVNFFAKSDILNDDKSRKYANKRAELWWETGREQFRLGTPNLAHMTDGETGRPGDVLDLTIADLTTARYDPESLADGLIQVEDKDAIRQRLGRSPDDGDAHLLAFYEPKNAGGVATVANTSGYSMPTGASSAVRH